MLVKTAFWTALLATASVVGASPSSPIPSAANAAAAAAAEAGNAASSVIAAAPSVLASAATEVLAATVTPFMLVARDPTGMAGAPTDGSGGAAAVPMFSLAPVPNPPGDMDADFETDDEDEDVGMFGVPGAIVFAEAGEEDAGGDDMVSADGKKHKYHEHNKGKEHHHHGGGHHKKHDELEHIIKKIIKIILKIIKIVIKIIIKIIILIIKIIIKIIIEIIEVIAELLSKKKHHGGHHDGGHHHHDKGKMHGYSVEAQRMCDPADPSCGMNSVVFTIPTGVATAAGAAGSAPPNTAAVVAPATLSPAAPPVSPVSRFVRLLTGITKRAVQDMAPVPAPGPSPSPASLDGMSVSACSGVFQIGRADPACTVCDPTEVGTDCASFENKTVLIEDGRMAAAIPGSQYWLIDPKTGTLTYTQPGQTGKAAAGDNDITKRVSVMNGFLVHKPDTAGAGPGPVPAPAAAAIAGNATIPADGSAPAPADSNADALADALAAQSWLACPISDDVAAAEKRHAVSSRSASARSLRRSRVHAAPGTNTRRSATGSGLAKRSKRKGQQLKKKNNKAEKADTGLTDRFTSFIVDRLFRSVLGAQSGPNVRARQTTSADESVDADDNDSIFLQLDPASIFSTVLADMDFTDLFSDSEMNDFFQLGLSMFGGMFDSESGSDFSDGNGILAGLFRRAEEGAGAGAETGADGDAEAQRYAIVARALASPARLEQCVPVALQADRVANLKQGAYSYQ